MFYNGRILGYDVVKFGKWLAGETNLHLQYILKLRIHGTTCGTLKMEAECPTETSTAACRSGCCIEKKAIEM